MNIFFIIQLLGEMDLSLNTSVKNTIGTNRCTAIVQCSWCMNNSCWFRTEFYQNLWQNENILKKIYQTLIMFDSSFNTIFFLHAIEYFDPFIHNSIMTASSKNSNKSHIIWHYIPCISENNSRALLP